MNLKLAQLEASGQAALYEGVLKLGVTEMIVHIWLRQFLKKLKRAIPEHIGGADSRFDSGSVGESEEGVFFAFY